MERRRYPRRRGTGNLRITLSGPDQANQEVAGHLLDESEQGIAVVSPVFLPPGSSLALTGTTLGASGRSLSGQARVQWCTPEAGGGYRAGLRLLDQGSSRATEADDDGRAEDYYDVLQVSSKAHPDTIHRVFRILAQRFHPDNAETGDAETFHNLMMAYQVLSDPEKRAAYDVQRTGRRDLRWKIFDTAASATGIEAEKRKRQGVLNLLYTKRISRPHEPTMTIREIEELLGCPKEHLEFCFWFLKERGLIARGDNGRLSITANGVDQAESNGQQAGRAAPAHRQLESAGSDAAHARP